MKHNVRVSQPAKTKITRESKPRDGFPVRKQSSGGGSPGTNWLIIILTIVVTVIWATNIVAAAAVLR